MGEYDRSKMQHKENILRFEWGDYPAIGIKHFEERRDERTKPEGTDIFDETQLSDEEVLLKCFEILKKEKYQEILDIIEKNKPKHTEFIAAFETDEHADKRQFNYIFLVFSISIKETAMNGIEQGAEFLSCITIVKDTYKKKRKLDNNTVEETMCCYRDEFGGDELYWKKSIPR